MTATPEQVRRAAAQASIEAMGCHHEGYMIAWLCTHLAAAIKGTSPGFLRLSDADKPTEAKAPHPAL